MQCPQCGKTGFVTINSKRYCSNCGAKLAASGKPATMAEVSSGHKTLDLRSAPASAAVVAKSATQLHGAQVAGGGVLDLRAKTAPAPTPAAAPAVKVDAPAPVKVETPAKVEEPVVTPAAVEVKPEAAPAAPAITAVAAQTKPAAPAPKAASATPPAPELPDAKSPLVHKFMPHPSQPSPTPVLPPAVATQVDAAKNANHIAPPTPPQSPALQQALDAAKKSNSKSLVLKLGGALAVVAILSGVVWLQNSPKLAFRSAASKAGISASLPTYIPSSYRQDGDVQTAIGQLVVKFKTPSSTSPLTITQKRTDWDADALRENYVNRQAANFLAIQGQGLTIYLYDDTATWVNHGVWYQVTGTSKLSREQVLKIAYGL